jgi:hypothetical protein
VFSQDNIVFVYLHGTVAFQVPDDELSRRLSLAMAITERRGYLLTWFFAAPHDAELQGLTNERAVFDKESAVNVSTTAKPDESKPSGATDAATAPPESSAPATSESSSPTTSASQPASSDPSSASSTDNSEPKTEPASDRPSLLKPGETMQTQQGKGPVIKPK